jgi:hypothetical protein
MMMDPSLMDEFIKEWWNLGHMEILQRRREAAALARGASTMVVMEPTVVMLDICMVVVLMVPFASQSSSICDMELMIA